MHLFPSLKTSYSAYQANLNVDVFYRSFHAIELRQRNHTFGPLEVDVAIPPPSCTCDLTYKARLMCLQ